MAMSSAERVRKHREKKALEKNLLLTGRQLDLFPASGKTMEAKQRVVIQVTKSENVSELSKTEKAEAVTHVTKSENVTIETPLVTSEPPEMGTVTSIHSRKIPGTEFCEKDTDLLTLFFKTIKIMYITC